MSDGQTDKQPAAVEFSSLEPVDSRLSKSPEIAKLHKECAKYRTALKTSNEEKEAVQRQFDDLQQEYKRVLNSKREQEILHKLQIKGCKKPELALRDIPTDCNDLDEFCRSTQRIILSFLTSQKQSTDIPLGAAERLITPLLSK